MEKNLVMIYIQEHIFENEENKLMIQWIFLWYTYKWAN